MAATQDASNVTPRRARPPGLGKGSFTRNPVDQPLGYGSGERPVVDGETLRKTPERTIDVPDGVLNPDLYRKLARRLGRVEIINRGQKTKEADGRVVAYGETYVTNCPFCGGDRKLYTRAEWGVGNYNWFRTKCWKRDCLADDGNRYKFKAAVYGDGVLPTSIDYSNAVEAKPWERRPVPMPGETTPVADLGPDHHATLYLEGRGFDVAELSAKYGVAYCDGSVQFPATKGRLIIPVTENGQMIAWQGRWVGEDYKATGWPKYYNLPGQWRAHVLYGIDDARPWPVPVIVEGIPAVWRVGAPAVATLGKVVSDWQAEKIVELWGPQTGKPGVAVVWADDRKAWEESVSKGCGPLTAAGMTVIPFVANDGGDPADRTREEARSMLAEAVAKVGFDPARLFPETTPA